MKHLKILYYEQPDFQVGYECVSLAWHPSGGALAAGSTEGHLVVLNADAGAHVATLRVCGSPLTCLAYNSGKKFIQVVEGTFFPEYIETTIYFLNVEFHTIPSLVLLIPSIDLYK